MKLKGRVWRFGEDVNTDVIAPGKYLRLSAAEIAGHVMEGIDPTFADKVQPGDIIVAGKNFGCGSSRESAPDALRLAGIGAIIAPFFGRIFFRNSINLGLPVIECDDEGEIAEGAIIELDLDGGTITNLTSGKIFTFPPLPPHLVQLLNAGGLVPYLEQRVLAEEAENEAQEQAVA